MRQYKIKEFSRRSGISPDTLRYYEKIGVFSPGRREENSYRTYTDYDLLDALQLRFLRGIGAPLADLQPVRSPHDLDQVMGQLAREERELEEEISAAAARLERVRMLSRELKECLVMEGKCQLARYPAMYSLYLPEQVDEAAAGVISRWVAAMPYAHVSFCIPEEEVDLNPGTKMRARIGYGILASYARELGIEPEPPLAATEPCEGVRCILAVGDPFFPKAEEFLPFTSFLREQGLTPEGPWHYRLRFFYEGPGQERRYFIAMRVKTRKG